MGLKIYAHVVRFLRVCACVCTYIYNFGGYLIQNDSQSNHNGGQKHHKKKCKKSKNFFGILKFFRTFVVEIKKHNIMTQKNLTISASLKDYQHQGNGISLFILNDREFYCMIESLCNTCAKKFAKFGGLDLALLESCSTLKAITRAARKELWRRWEESHDMRDDLEARKELTAYIFLTAEYIVNNK